MKLTIAPEVATALEANAPVVATATNEDGSVTAWTLDEILKLLHPFMPFITEELWRVTAERSGPRDGLLVLASWPRHDGLDGPAAEAEIGWVVDIISAIRSVRAEMNVPPGAMVPLALAGVSAETQGRAGRWEEFLKRLARLSAITFVAAPPPGAVQLVVRGEVAALPLAGIIDLAAERTRLEKEAAKVAADIARVDAKLSNPDFIRRAPEDVVEGEREKREDAEARGHKIADALARLDQIKK